VLVNNFSNALYLRAAVFPLYKPEQIVNDRKALPLNNDSQPLPLRYV
jgi:hypothetical protein